MRLKILKEAIETTDDEYYDYVRKNYEGEDELIDKIKLSDKNVRFIGGNIKTEKSDSGNFIARWAEAGDEAIIILGIVTKKGKMTREDIQDFKKWLGDLITEIDNGKVIMYNPNSLSMPLIKQIQKESDRRGIEIEIDVDETPVFKTKNQEWMSVKIYKA